MGFRAFVGGERSFCKFCGCFGHVSDMLFFVRSKLENPPKRKRKMLTEGVFSEGVDDLKIQVPVPKSLKDKDEDEGSTQSQKVRKNSLFST